LQRLILSKRDTSVFPRPGYFFTQLSCAGDAAERKNHVPVEIAECFGLVRLSQRLEPEERQTMSWVEKLEQVKSRLWFYEFELPDGTCTLTDVPEAVRPIHTLRREILRQTIERHVPDAASQRAFDFASHEGYHSLELARHFRSVRGYEIRPESLEAARLVTDVLGVRNAEYVQADLQRMIPAEDEIADFVLVYGLIYHLENPIHTLRLASQMTRKHILIETQVFPFEMSGRIEDGAYNSQRPVEGVFAVVPDYSSGREGGSTDLALVPSLNALLFVLRSLGFAKISVLPFGEGDYEQFARGSRVIVHGQKD
jgi:SAM-dependent methyltransferase